MPNDPADSGAKKSFQAEVSRLLELMVHSVYTEKEIFLRELISNASDACDKLRYEAIAAPDLIAGDARLAIRITIDKTSHRLSISDNGIGMTEAELVDNLGTIARSGTKAFLDRISAEKDASSSLIGQFGVGFYSAFMVADQIEVISRRAGAPSAHVWSSDGSSGFTVAAATDAQAATIARGTTVNLHLKSDADAYLDPHEIERIVRTYSDHILFPVELVEADDKVRQVNSASALWQRSKSEVKPEDYKEVYNTVAGQFDEPALTIHYKAEGRQSYAVLLFVPSQRPFDLFDMNRKGRVKLYVRRVYITEDADLLPSYLRFVRGVIDSEDVPLNISREMLQNNPTVSLIRKAVTSRVISELETLAEKEPARFEPIWETFGAVVKEGIYEDFERRDLLLKLARFRSTTGSTGWRSLKDYVAAMRPGQTEIYYLAGESLDRLKASPQLEAAAARGIEVLLLADHVDSFWTSQPLRFEDKTLRSLSQGEVDLSAIALLDETKSAGDSGDIASLITALKGALKTAISDVRASKRLVASASCLVAPGAGPDLALDRLLRQRNEGASVLPVLEINPAHSLVKAAAASEAAGRTDELADIAGLLHDQARILDGELPADPAAFAERINRLVLRGLVQGGLA